MLEINATLIEVQISLYLKIYNIIQLLIRWSVDDKNQVLCALNYLLVIIIKNLETQ